MTESGHIKPRYYEFFKNYPLLYHHSSCVELAIRNIAVGIKLDEKRHSHDIIKRADRKLKNFKRLENRLRKQNIFPHQIDQLRQIGDTAMRIKGNILEHYRVVRGRGTNDLEKGYVQREEDELVLLMAEGAYLLHSLTDPVGKHCRDKNKMERKALETYLS